MEPKKQLEYFRRLQEIEADGSIDKLEWEGLNLWPFFRMEMLHKVLSGDETSIHTPVQAAPKKPFLADRSHKITFKRLRKTLLKALAPALSERKGDILFFSESDVHYLDRIAGKRYNRHLDPYFEAARDCGFQPIKAHAWLKEGDGEDFMNPGLVLFQEQIQLIQDYLWTGLQIASPVPSNDALKVAEKLNVNVKRVMTQATYVRLLIPFADAVLDGWNLKGIALANYHNNYAQAFIAAARKRGIPTFDIQHGKQGRLNFSYSHFRHRITQGESLLPDGHWNWNEESAISISGGAGNESLFRCAVGGNLWLAKNVRQDVVSPTRTEEAFLSRLEESEHSVLICLQPQKDYLMPDWLEDYIRDHPEIFFGLRLHPRQVEQDRGKLAALENLPNVNVDQATSVFLFTALKYVNTVVTRWSTVALEARYFGKRAIVIDAFGLRTFARYIDDDQMQPGTNLEEWEKALETPVPEAMVGNVLSPVWSKDEIRQCFEFLLSRDTSGKSIFSPQKQHG